MKNTARDSYLFTEVMTTTPQKLHLMLIDAAIRAGQRAKKHWEDKENEQAGKCVMRAVKIINSILEGIDYQSKSELASKVAGVYLFIYRTLTRAFIDGDENKLAEALRVLAVERETWRLVCEVPAAPNGNQSASKTSIAPLASNLSPKNETAPDLPAGSFSLDA